MLIYENGDVTKYPVFCHQVNCKGVMGSGLAKQIHEKFPAVYTEYKELCDEWNSECLGHIQVVENLGLNNQVCVNMFAQENYGRNEQHTDYIAFKSCLREMIARLCVDEDYNDMVIAFPYGIGCGLGGGCWNTIREFLESFSNLISQKVVIVKKD